MIAIPWFVKIVISLAASKIYQAITKNKYDKTKSNSPTYGFPGWKPTSVSYQPVPVIFGINKVTGNWIWRTPLKSKTIYGALGIGEGKIQSIQDVRIDGKEVIDDLADCSFDTYLGTKSQIKDDRFDNSQPYDMSPSDDTFLASGLGSQGALYLLDAKWASSAITRKIYIQFDISQFPSDITILSAQLQIFCHETTNNGSWSIKSYGAEPAAPWSENTLVWGDDAAWVIGGLIEEVDMTRKTGRNIKINVKDWVNAHKTDDFVTFLINPYKSVDITVDEEASFYSKQNGARVPALVIEYESAIKGATFRNTGYISFTMKISEQLPTLTNNSISCLVEGLLIKNWDTTNSVWQTTYNNNPAWEILALMTNTRWGMGISESLIDLDSFKSTAVYCDAEITNTDGKLEKRFMSDIVIDQRMSVADAINDILASFAGYIYYVDGKIHLVPECAWVGSKLSFSEDTIIDGSFGFGKKDLDDVPNEIKVMFTDGSRGFVESYSYARDEIDQQTRVRVVQEIVLYAINRASQASRIAKFILNKSKLNPYWCSFQVGIRGMSIAPGDVIEVTHSIPGWTAKEMRVIECEETNVDELNLICEEYNSSLYNDDGLPYTASSSSNLPNPEGIPPEITGLTLTETNTGTEDDGTYVPQIKVTFTKPEYPYTTKYQIWWKPDGGTYQLAALTDDNTYYINVPGGGILYYVYVLTQTIRTGVTSLISASVTDSITIDGKVSLPTNVTFIDANCKFKDAVYLEWNKIDDKDLAFYEVRLNDGTWGTQDANLICQVDGTSYTLTDPGFTSDTFYIKARDNSGNYSATADSQVLTNSVPTMPALSLDFTMRDCVVTWAAVTDKDFKKYEVVVYEAPGYGGGDIIRTEEIQNPQYTYSFEMMIADIGSAIRTLYFRIHVYDNLGQTSYSDGNATNAVPLTPAQPTVTAQFSKLKIDWTTIAHPDILYYNVYCDTNADPVTVVAKISGNTYSFTGAVGTLYYVKISAVDSFGEGAKSTVNSGTPITIGLSAYDLDIPLHDVVISYIGSPEFTAWVTGTLAYKGTTYTIASGSSSNITHIYVWWDLASPTIFQSSATRPTIGGNIWLMAFIDVPNTTIYPATQNKIQHAGLLQASTITAELIGANEIIANTANIKNAIIQSAKIIDLDGDKIQANTINAGKIVVSDFSLPSDENLFAYWAFDDGSGLVAIDSSGNGRNGTLNGTMTDGDWIDGVSGKGLDLDGVDDYVSFALKTYGTADSWSVSLWVKEDAGNAGTNSFFFGRQGATGHAIGYNTSDELFFRSSDGTYIGLVSVTRTNLNHIVVTYNNGTIYFYINGTQYGSYTKSTTFEMNSIGNAYTGNTLTFDGLMDEIRIYSTDLDEYESRTLYMFPSGNQSTSISAYGIKTGVVESNDGKTKFDLDNAEIILDHPTANVKSVLKPAYLGKTFDDSNYHYYTVTMEHNCTADVNGAIDEELFFAPTPSDVFNLGSAAEYLKLRLIGTWEAVNWASDQKPVDLTALIYNLGLGKVTVSAPNGTYTPGLSVKILFLSFETW